MSETITTDSATQKYVAILEAEGFDPRVDRDDDIVFRYEGGNYIILLDPDDPQFLRLCYPGFLKTESEDHKRSVLAALNDVNMKIKVGKTFLVEDRCWAVVEALVPDPSYLASVLKRYLRIIQLMVKDTAEAAERK